LRKKRKRIVRIAGEVLVYRGEGGRRRGDNLVDGEAELMEQIVDEEGGAAICGVVAVIC
jgi:hypothetical protein